jgi:hypothetical protein
MKHFTETNHQFVLACNRCNEITEKFGAYFVHSLCAIIDWDITKIMCIEFLSFRRKASKSLTALNKFVLNSYYQLYSGRPS